MGVAGGMALAEQERGLASRPTDACDFTSITRNANLMQFVLISRDLCSSQEYECSGDSLNAVQAGDLPGCLQWVAAMA